MATPILNALATIALVGLTGLFGGSRFLGFRWWGRFWRWLSRQFDPLRARHWTLPAVVVTLLILISMVVLPALQAGASTAFLWLILAPYSIWLFGKGRFLRWLHQRNLREAVADGFGLPMNIASSGGKIGRLDRWGGVAPLLRQSVLILGATRSGKTEVAKHLVYQMIGQPNAPMVVYDHKEDFREFFDTLGIPYIRVSLSDSSHIWNLFREFENERDIDEFARALFPESGGDRRGGGSDAHFEDVARQTFAAILKMLDRDGSLDNPSNEDVVQYFRRMGPGEIHDDLSEHPDLRAAWSALDVEKNAKHAQNVYTTLQKRVNDVFVGDFAATPDGKGVAIRNYMRSPQGHVLLLDFPKDTGASTKPLFRFFLDWAARFGLTERERRAYFVFDEFARIPHLRRIGELVNVGAGQNVQVLVTLQSVTQLYDNYGEDRGDSILSGLTSKVLLRPNDDASTEYIRESIGTEMVEYTQHVEKRYSPLQDRRVEVGREMKPEEEHVFAKGDIRKWDAGVGVVVLPDGWIFGYVPMLHGGIAAEFDTAIESTRSEVELTAETHQQPQEAAADD